MPIGTDTQAWLLRRYDVPRKIRERSNQSALSESVRRKGRLRTVIGLRIKFDVQGRQPRRER